MRRPRWRGNLSMKLTTLKPHRNNLQAAAAAPNPPSRQHQRHLPRHLQHRRHDTAADSHSRPTSTPKHDEAHPHHSPGLCICLLVAPLATPDGPSHQTRRRPPTIPQREKEIQEQQEEARRRRRRRRPPASTKASQTPSNRLRTTAPNAHQETQTTRRRSQLRRPPFDVGASASLRQGRRSLPAAEMDAAPSVSGRLSQPGVGAPQPPRTDAAPSVSDT